MAGIPQHEIVFLVLIGSAGMLFLIGGIAMFMAVYQKRMLQSRELQFEREKEYRAKMVQMQLESQEAERKRIAADLHDSVGSLLWAAKLTASYIARLTSLQGEQKSSHEELMDILDQSISTVKRIAWELTPEVFQYAGLSESLSSLCHRFNDKGGLQVSFEEVGDNFVWNDSRALYVYRIVQELISNSVKHSNGSSLTVHLSWKAHLLWVEVSDNGKGFTLEKDREGVGWWNIYQRSNQLNATVDVGQLAGGTGSLVRLTVPLKNEVEEKNYPEA